MRKTIVMGMMGLWCAIGIIAQKINHPSLLYTPARIQQAKEQVRNDSKMAGYWEEIRKKADVSVERGNLNDMEYLSLAYLMTDEKKYSDKIKKILLDIVAAESWGNEEMLARIPVWRSDLGLAHKSYLSAVGYDAVYKELSASERKEIAKGLKRLALEPALGDWLLEPTRIHSLNSMGHNWWTACACVGGILALSLQNELPEAAVWADQLNEMLPEWFDFAGDVLQQKPKSFDENGGMYESLNYANFGIQEALQFRIAWMNSRPGKKPADIPQLAKLPDFFLHVCYPRTGILYNINLGDSHKNVTAESSLMLLYALGIRNDNMLWYFKQIEDGQHRDGYFRNRPMGFLYMPDTDKAPAVPNLKKSQLFADFGWATLRDSWEKDATMLVVKSGHTWNHSHADANSFILFHKGVDIIKDAGNCSYPNPPYRNYFFQSQAHNVVLFNGQGQSREQQYSGSTLRGYLHHLMDAGNMKYVLANGTGPMSDNFSRNYRHFLWIDNVIYIIDDLKTHKNGHFEWLWHPGGEAKKTTIDLNVTNGNSSVAIRPLYPRMLAKSNFVHDYPEDLYWEELQGTTEDLKGTETYYSFHLPGEFNRIKALTAVILKETPGEKNLPRMERREGKDWIGLRIRNKGKVTDLYINQLADGRLMHSNSWIMADGWMTDAYLFAVSYEEGTEPAEAKDLFVCYGSALRRGDTSYFSSLSKLFVIQKEENKQMKLWMEGQPKMHALLRSAKKPAFLEINNQSVPFEYTNGSVEIRCYSKGK